MPRDLSNILGYYPFDNAAVATHDPGRDGPCVVCMKTVGKVRIMRIQFPDRDPLSKRVYFFHVHNSCWLPLTDADQALYKVSLGAKP